MAKAFAGPFFAVLVACAGLSAPSCARADSLEGEGLGTPRVTYRDLLGRLDDHRERMRREGYSYMIGGGLGLISSLGLDITSTEVVPKLGYGLIEVLSSGAISYGAILHFNGDDFVHEMENLKSIENQTPGMSAEAREALLDRLANSLLEKERERQKSVRRIRGTLELTTAGSALLSLSFSKVKGTSSNLVLGFIFLITTAGGLSDILGPAEASGLFGVEGLALSPLLTQPGLAVALRF